MSEGIKETKELLKFVIDFGEAIETALADKKFEIAELSLLIAPLMQVGPAFEGIDKLGGEMKDLTEAEMAELKAYVEDELDLKNDNLEEIIERGLGLAITIYSFVKLFKKTE